MSNTHRGTVGVVEFNYQRTVSDLTKAILEPFKVDWGSFDGKSARFTSRIDSANMVELFANSLEHYLETQDVIIIFDINVEEIDRLRMLVEAVGTLDKDKYKHRKVFIDDLATRIANISINELRMSPYVLALILSQIESPKETLKAIYEVESFDSYALEITDVEEVDTSGVGSSKDSLTIALERDVRWLELGMDVFSTDTRVLMAVNNALKTDVSNQNPYHNPGHMKAVAIRADELFCSFATNHYSDVGEWNYARQVLFLASSIHDLGHSGGKESDEVNVQLSMKLARDLMALVSSQKYFEDVPDVIRVTQYPFIREPWGVVERCIRDADLMMCLEEDWGSYFEGLKTEMDRPDLTWKDNLAFLRAQTFYTDKAEEIMKAFFKEHSEPVEPSGKHIH